MIDPTRPNANPLQPTPRPAPRIVSEPKPAPASELSPGRNTNPNLTELIIILDASASMGRVKAEVIDGFNQLIEDQKKQPGECNVTLVQFSSAKSQETILDCRPLALVKPLTADDYKIMGMTALCDAIGSTVDAIGRRLSDTPQAERPNNVIVAIMTDGGENDSREYTAAVVKAKVEQQRDVYQWEFVFTAANQDAVLVGGTYGMDTDLAATYQASAEGTRESFRGMSAGVSQLRCGNKRAAIAAVKHIEGQGK